MTTPADEQTRRYSSREAYLDEQEQHRREHVRAAKEYYNGQQYDADNEACLREWLTHAQSGEKSLARNLFDQYQLPEHLRRHAYSTQIAKAVNWIADRLADSFAVEATPDSVHEALSACLSATPELAAGDGDEDRTVALVLRESLKAGDVPVLIRWDPAEGTCWLEFWDSEQVDMRFTGNHPDRLESVAVRQIDWRSVDGQTRQVTLERRWSVDGSGEDRDCVERVYLVDEGDDWAESPVESRSWGVPFLPWGLLRAERASLRATRGASIISTQIMRHADRYNANEQNSWLIARYNSHGNLAVVGDAAMLQKQDNPIHKDVADVLTFPGGTGVHQVALPTDTAMIEHQKQTLIDAMYERFGLVRTDQSTVSNLGEVSGYALEILNEQSDNTFSRIRAQLVKDFKKLFNTVIDCHRRWSAGNAADEDDTGQSTSLAAAAVDTTERTITVRLGSGWVVDEAAARDNYLAGTISRREFLRTIGKSDTQIDGIEDELAAETAEAEPAPREGTAPRPANGSTWAGSTVNNTTTGRRPFAGQGPR